MKHNLPMLGFILMLKPKNIEFTEENLNKIKIMPVLVSDNKEINKIVEGEKDYDLVGVQSYSMLKRQQAILENLATLNKVTLE